METTFTSTRQHGSNSAYLLFGTLHSLLLALIFILAGAIYEINPLSAQGGCVMSCPGMETIKEISIDNDCVDTLNTDLMGMVPNNCTGDYVIQIMDDDGNDLGDIITEDMINNVYMVIITNIDDNQVCMMNIRVIDKQKPEISVCPPDVTFECSFDVDSYDASDLLEVIECSEYSIDSYDEVVFAASCQGDTVAKYNRIYIVTDEYNNSTSCTQMISLIKADLGDVTYPDKVVLDCFPEPDVSPGSTGAPMIAGFEISNGLFCNLSFDFNDQTADLCSGGYKIIRTFIVTDWCANNSTTTGQQIIEVLDRTPPVVVAPPDAVVSTSSSECTADINLPPAQITEDCSEIQSVRIQWPFGTMYSNGGIIEDLPVGVYDIEYIVTNDCDSVGTDVIRITVEDNEPPNPICHQSVAIPVASNGEAIISAESLDAASYDNCGPVWFKAKRMTAPGDYDCHLDGNPAHQFDDFIKLCCADIPNNKIMVILRVYDREPDPGPVSDSHLQGRWNECMMEIEVQDKIAPSIECPSDLTVSCEFAFDPDNLSVFGSIAQHPLEREQICIDDPGSDPPGFSCPGIDGLAQDNCVAHIDETGTVSMDSCGTGMVIRTFTATDDAGFSSSCTQYVTIKNFNLFTEGMIDWPEDYSTQNICSVDLLDPDDLEYPYNQPVLYPGPCDLVTFDYTDEVYDFSQFDQACFKIIRKWTVIDWCQFNSEGEEGIWVFYQQIKSLNSIAPVFTSENAPVEICSVNQDCGPETVTLTASATDDCSSENTLTWRYQIDEQNDNIIDQTISPGTGASITFDYTFPIGEHRVIFTVFDKCGNQSSKEQFVTITSCTGPSPKCIVGLSTTLMPVAPDWGMVTVWASEFDGGSDHPCGLAFDVAFSPDPNDDAKVFTCDDVGIQEVLLYVIDENGLSDFCVTNIIIDDNSSVCPGTGTGTGQNGFISGDIKTETFEGVNETMIYLNGSPLNPEQTAGDGAYAFTNMPFGGSYEVEPKKDGDDMNGVSTLDLLRIQRHLLGIENFDHPNQYIAADANRSGTVTAIDILELRKLILGIYEELPENSSWRFIDKDYQFTDPNNPLAESFPETYAIAPFEASTAQVDFTAIKIGDLNGSVKANASGDAIVQVRSNEDALKVLCQQDESGDLVTFTAMNMKSFQTAQFSLVWDPDVMHVTHLKPSAPFTLEHFNIEHLAEGKISFAWFGTEPVAKGEVPLFTLETASSGASGPQLSAFRFSESPTPVEASDLTGHLQQIELQHAVQVKPDGVKLYQNIPNPFSEVTEIRFELPIQQKVEISLYDMAGRKLLAREMEGAEGLNALKIHKREINAQGVLIYELKTASGIKTRRMIID